MAASAMLPEKGEFEDLKLDSRVDSIESNTKDVNHEVHDDTKGVSNIDSGAPPDEYVTGVGLWTVLAAITLVFFLMMLDMSIVATAIPQITNDFHSLLDVGWYGSAYLLSICAVQPLTGTLYSQFSPKYTFLVFLGIFEVGSALSGAAQSSAMLIVGRAISGIGGSGISNGGMTILSNSCPLHKRPAMLGAMMSIGQLGIIAGPVLGGAFTQFVTWRWCFYINLPIGAVAAIILLFIEIPSPLKKIPSAERKTPLQVLQKIDFLGFFLFAGSAIMLLFALQWGGVQFNWDSSTILGLFCGAAVVFTIFAGWQYYLADSAMIPLSAVSKKEVFSACCLVFFFFASMMIQTYFLPIYFQSAKGASPSKSGIYILPSILAQMLTSIVSGVLVGRFGYYLPWSIASSILMTVGAGLISTFEPDTSTAKWVMYQFISGFGRGCGLQMPLVAIQTVLPPQQTPIGIAIVLFFQTLGGTVFLSVGELIFTHSLKSGLKSFAPTTDIAAVLGAGATGFRQVITLEEVGGVVKAYAHAIDHVFYLGTATAGATFLFCWGLGWHKVTKKVIKAPSKAEV